MMIRDYFTLSSVSLRDFSMKLSRLDPKGQMINEAPKRAL